MSALLIIVMLIAVAGVLRIERAYARGERQRYMIRARIRAARTGVQS